MKFGTMDAYRVKQTVDVKRLWLDGDVLMSDTAVGVVVLARAGDRNAVGDVLTLESLQLAVAHWERTHQ